MEVQHKASGFALRPLTWDSAHFGLSVAQLVLDAQGVSIQQSAEVLHDATQAIRQAGIKLTYCRVPAESISWIHALERHGFNLMDQLVTFERNTVAGKGEEGIRLLRERDTGVTQELVRLSEGAFALSRFYQDMRLDRTLVDQLYSRWVCTLVAEGEVLAVEQDGRLAGYVACRQRSGIAVIDLITVAPWARGGGLGRRLVEAARVHFFGCCDRLQVGTQLSNRAAVNLYESCGLRLVRSELTFHLWTDSE